MKIMLYVALLICALAIITGIAAWFTSNPIFVKFLMSSITIAPGVAFGITLIEILKER